MADVDKVIRGWQRCQRCSFPGVLGDQSAYLECEYTTGLYCRQDNLISETLDILKEQDARIKKYEYVFNFLGIGFREWATKILDGEAEVICETDEHERKTVITFKHI